MPRSDVEAIRGERIYRKTDHQFLVKYVGFDEYTWEPAGTILEQVADKVEEYWKRHPAVNTRVLYHVPNSIGTGEDWRPAEVIRVVHQWIYLEEDTSEAEKEKQARKGARPAEKRIQVSDQWMFDITGTELPATGARVAVYFPGRLGGKGWEKGSITSASSGDFYVTFDGESEEYEVAICATSGTWLLAETLEALRALSNAETEETL